jgi:hypothetical protein
LLSPLQDACGGQEKFSSWYVSSKGKNMRRILLNDRCPLFKHHFVRALFAAGLLIVAAAASAGPRPPLPPAPEGGVMLRLSFDLPLAYGDTNAQEKGKGVNP